MHRLKRIAGEVLLPPLLGGLPFAVGGAFLANANPVVIFFAWLVMAGAVMGIPAIIYAALMETAFALGLRPNSSTTVWLSSVLGLIAGASVVAPVVWKTGGISLGIWGTLPPLGLLVGWLIGQWISRASAPPANSAVTPPTSDP